MERNYPVYTVTKKAELSLKNGHPWVYGEEVVDMSEVCPDGALADVAARRGITSARGTSIPKAR